MKLLKIEMKGITASFRLPFAITGYQVVQNLPSYANLLGLISCIRGKETTPNDTRIGFEFSYESKFRDLERITRWSLSSGKLKLNIKGPAIRQREILSYPHLTLYLSNLNLKDTFKFPKGIPTFGRSQDVAKIVDISEIEVKSTDQGEIKGTMIPLKYCKNKMPNGIMFRLPEFMEYNKNLLRQGRNKEIFLCTESRKGKTTKIIMEKNLFSLKDDTRPENCIYLHQWL